MAPEPEYAVELNSYLQGHPSGDLTPHFQYILTAKPGSYLQPAHYANAKFDETVIGEGRGLSKGAAKRDAARAAIQYIHQHGLPDPIEIEDSDAVLDLQNYLQIYPEGSLIPRFSWSVSQTGPDHRRTHRAIAQIDGSEIGYGVGFSVDHAKQIAAAQALEYLHANAQPPPLPHPQEGENYKPDWVIDWDHIFALTLSEPWPKEPSPRVRV